MAGVTDQSKNQMGVFSLLNVSLCRVLIVFYIHMFSGLKATSATPINYQFVW